MNTLIPDGSNTNLKEALAGVSLVKIIWDLLRKNPRKIVAAKSDRFLEYDPKTLCSVYTQETPVTPALAYVLACEFSSIRGGIVPRPQTVKIRCAKKQFELTNGKSPHWTKSSIAGFDALVKSGRVNQNEPLVRISGYRIDKNKDKNILVLNAQRARYHDQARSNLILDFCEEDSSTDISLRKQLDLKYQGKLPELSDKRLANTLGVALLIFYRSEAGWVPYFVRRVEKIGVFPGGIHCSASGAVKWPEERNTFSFDDITEHLYDEVDEELKINRDELINLKPVAFCREMARGGKPQMFYCAQTDLTRKELANKRVHAARVIRKLNQWEEIERDSFYKSSDIVMSPNRLRRILGAQEGGAVTLEAAAALYFGLQYLRDFSAR